MTTGTLINKIEALSNCPIRKGIVSIVKGIAASHGVADLPAGGPSTNAPAPYSRADLSSIGEWGGQESEVLSLCNKLQDQLFELVDVRAIGGGQYVTQYDKSPEFLAFSDEAFCAISEFVTYEFWDSFCQHAESLLTDEAA